MKINVLLAPNYMEIYRNHFKDSVPEDLEIVEHYVDISNDVKYLDFNYFEVLRSRLEIVIESLRENTNEIEIWSDTDIVFNPHNEEKLSELIPKWMGSKNFIFQRLHAEDSYICSGFYAVKKNERSLEFLEFVYEIMERHPNLYPDEKVINEIFRRQKEKWGDCLEYFPCRKIAAESNKGLVEKSDETILYHANRDYKSIQAKKERLSNIDWG